MIDQRIALLDANDRNRLESWVMEFELDWSPHSFGEWIKQRPSETRRPLRDLILAEIVKVDLHRQWSSGSRVLLEQYLEQAPELGRLQNVSADLIMAEYDARRAVDAKVDLASYEARFPNQFEEVKRMATELTDSMANQAPSVQASVDTSRIKKAKDTTVGSSQGNTTDELPSEFGRYRILRELGAGAMGRVYLAHDSQLDRHVALKTPSFSSGDNDSMVTRFYREARSAAKLHHRNICPVFDVGKIEGRHFISMAFVRGRSMADLIRPDKLPPPKTSAILIHRLASALTEAHRHNVIHRDLKPANIMIDTKKEPVVMDFGLARQTDVESRVTQSGMAVGTPAYMSPEQVRGDIDDVGAPSDIYALGVILYELLCGQLPFRGGIAKVVYSIVHDEPTPPSAIGADIDPELESICLKMMAKNLNDRYQSMVEVATALKTYLKPKQTKRRPEAGQTSTQSSPTAQDPAARQTPSTQALVKSAAGLDSESSDPTETEALNAFFAAQVAGDPTKTMVESLPSKTPNVLVDLQPKTAPRHRRSKRYSKWISAGSLGILILAGVIVYFTDGSKLDIPSGTTAIIETNADGTLKQVTVEPSTSTSTASKNTTSTNTAKPRIDTDGIIVPTVGDARQLAVSPSGESVVFTGSDSPGRFTILDTETGRQRIQFDDPQRPGLPTNHLQYSGDGESLLYCTGNEVRVVTAASGLHQSTFDFPSPPDLTVFPKQPWAAALYYIRPVHRKEKSDVERRLRIWDWETGQTLYDEPSGEHHIRDFTVSPDERFLILGHEHLLTRYTLEHNDNQISLTTQTAFEPTSRVRGAMTFSRDGNYVACSIKSRECIGVVVDAMTGQIVTKLNPETAATSNVGYEYGCDLAFTPDSQQIVVADHTGHAGLWDVQSGRLIQKLGQFSKVGLHFPPGVAVGPNGAIVLGGTSQDKQILIKQMSDLQSNSGLNQPATKVINGEWTELFNGSDLSGWTEKHCRGVFAVNSGYIFCRSSSRKEKAIRGWLETDRHYDNFELELEYNLDRSANSGIFLRTQPSAIPNGLTQLEVQLLDDAGWESTHFLKNLHRNGAVYNVAAPEPRTVSPANRWNHMRIRADGPQVTVHCNGTQVVDVNLNDKQSLIDNRFQYNKPGPIGLQWHGTLVRYRNLRIRELQ